MLTDAEGGDGFGLVGHAVPSGRLVILGFVKIARVVFFKKG
jgi:hypothetical protein